MRMLGLLRILSVAMLLCVIPASAFAGVGISVTIAPPVMPVYVQPPCPHPGYIWTPGYWAYGDEGYYWVPGAWVPAPYEGALWTPGYWGWSAGVYLWHPGYWGHHVGYYGGINYGFGYFGVGYVGGEWRGRVFHYNTAITRVDVHVVRNVYVNRTVISNRTIVHNHMAFNGPGGVRYSARASERIAERDHHIEATRFQHEHEQGARGDRGAYFSHNGGRPSNLAAARPLQEERHAAPPRAERPRPAASNRNSAPRPAAAQHEHPVQQQHGPAVSNRNSPRPAAVQHEHSVQQQHGPEGKQEHQGKGK